MRSASDANLDAIVYDERGLAPVIVQDRATGTVLMLAWTTAETLALSLAEGRTVFWSRSRREIWRKGETSGNVQRLVSAHYDCDGDVVLFVVDQVGEGACHTGEFSCFYRSFDGYGAEPQGASDDPQP